MRKSIKIFGKAVPLWLLATMLVAVLGVAITQIGIVKMHWQVEPPTQHTPSTPTPQPSATMNPEKITLEIGELKYGETKTVEPTKVGELTVENGAVDLTVSLEGDYSGFDALNITIQLVQDGEVKYEAVLEPTIVVSDTLEFGPNGWGGWSSKTASETGEVVTCFVRNVGLGEGDLEQLVKWKPGESITIGDKTYTYPDTPFGYTYDKEIPETGCIAQNDNDHDSIQLVVVYPPTSATIENVEPGTYEVYIGYKVTAGRVADSGEAQIIFSIQ